MGDISERMVGKWDCLGFSLGIKDEVEHLKGFILIRDDGGTKKILPCSVYVSGSFG